VQKVQTTPDASNNVSRKYLKVSMARLSNKKSAGNPKMSENLEEMITFNLEKIESSELMIKNKGSMLDLNREISLRMQTNPS
jgi:hypothetical protein